MEQQKSFVMAQADWEGIVTCYASNENPYYDQYQVNYDYDGGCTPDNLWGFMESNTTAVWELNYTNATNATEGDAMLDMFGDYFLDKIEDEMTSGSTDPTWANNWETAETTEEGVPSMEEAFYFADRNSDSALDVYEIQYGMSELEQRDWTEFEAEELLVAYDYNSNFAIDWDEFTVFWADAN